MNREQNIEASTLFESPNDEVGSAAKVNEDGTQCQTPPSSGQSITHLNFKANISDHNCVSECWKSIRKRFSIIVQLLMVALIVACFGVYLVPHLLISPLHSSSAFELSDSPQDTHIILRHAILANRVEFSVGDGLLEAATYSSSTNSGREMLADWSIFQSAKADEFKPALLPQRRRIVDGIKLIEPYHSFVNHRVIVAPANQLVDLSRVNYLGDFAPIVLHLTGGDYITTNLTLSNHHRLVNTSDDQRIRIFIQDQGFKKGIIVNNGEIEAKHPANLQIWYNGTGKIKFTGTSHISAVIYAPNADLEIEKDVMFRGAIVCRTAHITGGFILYDRDLSFIKDW